MANVTHTIKNGETLTTIANKYKAEYYPGKTTSQVVTAIKNLNPDIIKDVNKIYAGDTIVISGTSSTSTTSDAKVSKTAYDLTVRLQSDSDRNLIARWKWSKNSDTDHYLVRWWYSASLTDDGNGILAVQDQKVTTGWLAHEWTAPDNALRVTFCVKPVAKTKKQGSGSNQTEVPDFTADRGVFLGAGCLRGQYAAGELRIYLPLF